jgi:hypothetical protein
MGYFKDSEVNILKPREFANREQRGQQLCNGQGGSSQRIRRTSYSWRNANEMVLEDPIEFSLSSNQSMGMSLPKILFQQSEPSTMLVPARRSRRYCRQQTVLSCYSHEYGDHRHDQVLDQIPRTERWPGITRASASLAPCSVSSLDFIDL